jgi:dTMP kinase
MKGKGFFICIEGLDGCGKTTQTRLLVRALRRNGYHAVYTSEPSRGKIGEFIKKRCLLGKNRGSGVVEALLFAADRFEHVEKEITPALNQGKLVVSDRYVYSSMAYQGATGLDLKWIQTINKHALRADLSLFIDLEPETAMKRLKPRKSVMENLQNQRRVREVYLKFVEKGDLVRIDGNKTKKEVADNIAALVLGFLQKACE